MSFAELAKEYDTVGQSTVFVAFRAPDCGLSADLIDRLNAIDSSRTYRVVAVVLFPPESASDHDKFVERLGIRFPTVADSTGDWARAIKRDGFVTPQLIVRTKGRTLGAISPEFLRTYGATGLVNVPLEREK